MSRLIWVAATSATNALCTAPGQIAHRLTLVPDNPGVWVLHCHNTYHQEAGMMTSLDYTIG